MNRMLSQSLAVMLACLLTACATINHNIPQADPISAGAPADRITIYADANGHLYPDNWRALYDPATVERLHSLLASRGFDVAVHRELRQSREAQLNAAVARLAGRSRIFILVHGFNNTQPEARHAFEVVRSRLPLTADDGVVEFHWDGLSSLSDIGRGSMWFNAVGYSQVAGTQALRGLLWRLRDVPVYLISHSRGASVVLSALSDPSYNARFRDQTVRILGDDFDSDPLPDEGSPIRAIMLAPAIGNPDFWRSDRSGEGCAAYRDFPRRLRSIRYSVNGEDPVLRKPFGLASRFNATDFGYRAGVGSALKACYDLRPAGPDMQAYTLSMPQHGFIDYVLTPEFAEMVDAAIRETP